jgi:hypothetical protein
MYFAHKHVSLIGKNKPKTAVINGNTKWFKYDRDKLLLVYTQIVPVIFEPPCIMCLYFSLHCRYKACVFSESLSRETLSAAVMFERETTEGDLYDS